MDSPMFENNISAEERPRLENIKALLSVTEEGRGVLAFLAAKKIPVVFAEQESVARYAVHRTWKIDKFDILDGSESLKLNPKEDDAHLAGSIVHEVRHARQNHARQMYRDQRISLQDYIWNLRVLEADAEAEAVLVCFRAKLAGHPDMFDARKNSAYGDMCLAAEKIYAADPISIEDGRLKRAAFDVWFSLQKSEIKHGYDSNAISSEWLSRQAEFNLIAQRKYPAVKMTKEDIAQMACVANEQGNYLALPGFKPLDDPYYTEDFAPEHVGQINKLTKKWLKQHVNDNVTSPQKVLGKQKP